MQLDLGGIETLESPTKDDVRHYLKFMPVESPFVILSNDSDEYIQSFYNGEKFYVEYSIDKGVSLFYARVHYETASKLFLDFYSGQSNYREIAEWKRVRFPYLFTKIVSVLGTQVYPPKFLEKRRTA